MKNRATDLLLIAAIAALAAAMFTPAAHAERVKDM